MVSSTPQALHSTLSAIPVKHVYDLVNATPFGISPYFRLHYLWDRPTLLDRIIFGTGPWKRPDRIVARWSLQKTRLNSRRTLGIKTVARSDTLHSEFLITLRRSAAWRPQSHFLHATCEETADDGHVNSALRHLRPTAAGATFIANTIPHVGWFDGYCIC